MDLKWDIFNKETGEYEDKTIDCDDD